MISSVAPSNSLDSDTTLAHDRELDLYAHWSYFPALGVNNRTYFNYGGQGVIRGAALNAVNKNFRHKIKL